MIVLTGYRRYKMKKFKHILLTVVALATLTLSCVEPLEITPDGRNRFPEGSLVFSPKILGITPGTKTPGEDSRGENTIRRIDVFVFKTTGGTSTFHKHYTIEPPAGQTELTTGNDYLLESDWRNATPAYTASDTYNIYAIANIAANKLRDPVFPQNPTEAELRSLTSESDAQIPGEHGYTCYDIIRLKNPNGSSPAAQSLDHHIGDKVFLMDGKVIGWRITDETQTQQYFVNNPTTGQQNVFEFARAAAKFRVELDFSSDFKASLGTDIDGTGLKFRQVTETYESGRPKSARIITIGSLQPDDNNVINAGCAVTGGALAKFANILKATYDWDPTTAGGPSSEAMTAFRDANRWDSQNFYEFSCRTPNPTGGYKYPYIDTTYSYAFSWDADKSAEYAPALAVSIVYTTYTQKYNDDADSSFDGPAVVDPKNPEGVTNYYRIPLVDITKTGSEAITSVDRNTYYQVTAYINTYGTSTTEIVPTDVSLNYKVIPWPYMPDEVTQAQTTQLQYFVAETEYRLRGDDDQWVYLQYFTPKSNPKEKIGETTYNYATPKIKNVRVYYYNQDNQEKVLATALTGANDGAYIWDGSSTDAYVTIEVQPSTTDNGGGNIYVNSTALSNRSIKYITFDAEVDFSYDGGQKVTRSFVVTHFPLDNLQSISGAWSSRWDEQPASGTRTVYYRKRFFKRTETVNPVTQAEWAAGVGNDNNDRKSANSRENAVNGFFATGERQTDRTYSSNYITSISGYVWDGTRVTFSGSYLDWWGERRNFNNLYYDNFDYLVSYNVNSGQASFRFGTYSSYFQIVQDYSYSYTDTGDWATYDGFEWEECTQAEYNNTADANRKTATVKNHPGTGRWVDWDRDGGQDYNRDNAKYTYDGSSYQAKVFYNGRVYPIDVTRTGNNNNNYRYTYNRSTSYNNANNWHCYWTNGTWATQNSTMDLTNNHMYVVQISRAGADAYGNDIILGKPSLDGSFQSNDNTVSPAFMIASQLGANLGNTYSANSAQAAAIHCHTYMEVAQNGYRFTGWRLPTQAEIAYIVQYQTTLGNTDVFDTVLGGDRYYTLNATSGNNYNRNQRWERTKTSVTGEGTTNIRCIRDLTPEEVIELNRDGVITAASY